MNQTKAGDFGVLDKIIADKSWFTRSEYNFPVISPILTFLSTHHAFRDYC